MKSLLISAILLLNSLFTLNAHDTFYKDDHSKADPLVFENIYAKTDTTRNSYKRKPLLYGGLGIGIGNRGFVLSNDFTFILSNNWGGNISYKMNFAKSKDIPDDFYDYGIWRTPPYDYVFILAINLIREFPGQKNTLRYGIETGPSWVNYQKADFSNYQDVYDYNHNISNTIGLSIRGKVEFLLNRSIGIELAAFTNINSINSVIGIECFFHFGRVRDKIKE